MICPECGKENKEGSKFCKNCGTSLSGVQSNVHKENIENVKSKAGNVSSSNGSGNKNTLIICATAIICVIIVAGALIALNSPNTVATDSSADSSNSANVVSDANSNDGSDSNSDSNSDSDAKTAESSDSDDSSSSSAGMTFDEAKTYLSDASNTVARNTFDEADADGDGVLTGSEISKFKSLASLTERTADTSNTEHVEAQDYGGTGDGTTKTRYCTTHGRVAVGEDNRCPYCEAEGLDSRTVKGSTEYI